MELYHKASHLQTRWASFENPKGLPGQAAQENQGAKGHAFERFKAGETKVLMDVAGTSGTVRRIWLTVRPRDPKVLRGLRLDMYWDGAAKPAVSVPLGDFFCWILGRPASFENEFFASPEGRSFTCYIPMPFRNAARIAVTNESGVDLPHFFYDVDYTLGDRHDENTLYFHASWRRERWTELGKDFEILPKVTGEGRFLGCNIGVIVNSAYKGWWGEGEAKMYLDGDTTWPTIAGTGTEDYISTGWGQGIFAQRYHGSLVADKGQYGFYRFHVPDPVYFHKDCRVTIQQMGGTPKRDIVAMQQAGVPLTPVSVDVSPQGVDQLLAGPNAPKLADFGDNEWVNFYRQDDVCAVAYYYLDSSEGQAPPLAPADKREEAIE